MQTVKILTPRDVTRLTKLASRFNELVGSLNGSSHDAPTRRRRAAKTKSGRLRKKPGPKPKPRTTDAPAPSPAA